MLVVPHVPPRKPDMLLMPRKFLSRPGSRRLSLALVRTALALCAGLIVVGCRKPIEMREYEVSKPPHRMLGAMIMRGDEAWFFKVTGPREGLGAEAARFEEFLKSVRFGEASSKGPTWNLPEGWKETGASEMRFQTIKFTAGGEECELSVSKLPMQASADGDDFLLRNLNRWRGQIELWPILSDELEQETRRVSLADGTVATVVDLVGTLEPKSPAGKGGMGMGMGRDMLSGEPPTAPKTRPSQDLKYKLPEGWQEAEAARFSRITFEVRDGKQQVKITVTDLPAASNPLLDNINRWRGIMKLPPVDEAGMKRDVQPIKVGDVSGSYVELATPDGAAAPQALLGVVAYQGETAWFVKLQGDAALATREKTRFEEFVRSLQF